MALEELDRSPAVMTGRNFALALLVHAAVFLAFYGFMAFFFRRPETVIPLDLTLVVNENLDGNDEEPPPTRSPEPEPPPPPKPEPKTEEPPPVVDEKTDAIVKTPEKVEPPKPKKTEERPKEPEKTREQLREERKREMLKRTVARNGPVKIEVKDAPSGNGRTERKTLSDDEIRKLLSQGYRPGKTTQLAANEMQRCLSLVQMAINRKWDEMSPQIGSPGNALLSFRLTAGGGVTDVRLVSSCGDATSDAAALRVARAIGHIAGLSPDFIAQYTSAPLTINYRISNR